MGKARFRLDEAAAHHTDDTKQAGPQERDAGGLRGDGCRAGKRDVIDGRVAGMNSRIGEVQGQTVGRERSDATGDGGAGVQCQRRKVWVFGQIGDFKAAEGGVKQTGVVEIRQNDL